MPLGSYPEEILGGSECRMRPLNFYEVEFATTEQIQQHLTQAHVPDALHFPWANIKSNHFATPSKMEHKLIVSAAQAAAIL